MVAYDSRLASLPQPTERRLRWAKHSPRGLLRFPDLGLDCLDVHGVGLLLPGHHLVVDDLGSLGCLLVLGLGLDLGDDLLGLLLCRLVLEETLESGVEVGEPLAARRERMHLGRLLREDCAERREEES